MCEFANKANLSILIMKIIYKHSYVAGRCMAQIQVFVYRSWIG